MAAAQLDACDGPAGDAWQRGLPSSKCIAACPAALVSTATFSTWHAEHATAHEMSVLLQAIHGIASELHMDMAAISS
jgi:hypothetical protein